MAKRRDAQRQLAQQRIQEWMTACAQQRGTGRKPRARSRRCSDGAQPRAWSTEGQCEGRTRDGDRCKVHRSSRYAVAAPLRRGERFCGHHHPDKYTGVRCAGIKKHGKGQCRVWSGSCYADALPLRRGSPYCHHHRVRCAGQTRTGVQCTVTSSSEHAHANPLRQGGLYCTHHQVQGAQSDAPAPTPPTSIATPPPGTAAADAVASPTALSLTLLASSAERPFRDAKGELAPTVLMIGRLAEDGDTHVNLWRQLAQRVRECFPQFSYIDVILGGQTKSAWSLPLDAHSRPKQAPSLNASLAWV